MTSGAPGRAIRCDECGHERKIGPGDRQRVVFFLERQGVDTDTAMSVFESRNDLAHGSSHLSDPELRRFSNQAEIVMRAVRDALARELGLTLPPMPVRLPIDPTSAMLDITHHPRAPMEQEVAEQRGSAATTGDTR